MTGNIRSESFLADDRGSKVVFQKKNVQNCGHLSWYFLFNILRVIRKVLGNHKSTINIFKILP